MALPAINIIFDPGQFTAINTALDTIETNSPFRINIPAGEKDEESGMNVRHYPFVKDVVNNIAPSRVDLQPGYMPLADAVNDVTLYDQFMPIIMRISSILESFIDTQFLAGVEGYAYFRTFYANVQEAAKRNVPGADAILNNLKRLYEVQGDAPVTPP